MNTIPLLFLGNSYTMNQDLDRVTAALLSEGTGAAHEGVRLAGGGLTFEVHAERAAGGHPDWVAALAGKEAAWSWVFLQEQSQIPGFPEHNPYVQGSLAAAGTLDGYARDRGAQTVLVMTWGRRDGDPDNPSRYPDFTTMQALLMEGYLRYVETWSADKRPVWVAPAGLAWQHIHDEIVATGGDPLAPDSLFVSLYGADGSHPSPAGNHLAAAVIYATLTGESPVGLADPTGTLDPAILKPLQAAAAAVVLGDSPDILYPWEDPDDTGKKTPDTDGKDTDSKDTDGKDTDPPEDSGQQDTQHEPVHGEPEETNACGCATGSPVGGLWAVMLALAAAGRRRLR